MPSLRTKIRLLREETGRMIRVGRRQAKLTPSELLDKAGFKATKASLKKLRDFESGESDITFDIFCALARALNKNVMLTITSSVCEPRYYLKDDDTTNEEQE